MLLKKFLDFLVKDVIFLPLVRFVSWVDLELGRRRHIKQQARFIFLTDKPSRADREQAVCDGTNVDALAWIACHDSSPRRRQIAWGKIKQMNHVRALVWIKYEASDENIKTEAEKLLSEKDPEGLY